MHNQKLNSRVRILKKTFDILLITLLSELIFVLSHHIQYEI